MRTIVKIAAAFLILAISNSYGAQSEAMADFTGSWQSEWGVIVLKQEGDRVSGSYGEGRGTIEGTVVGNRLVYNWTEGEFVYGDGFWLLSRDGDSMRGKWRYGGEEKWAGRWNAVRIKGATVVISNCKRIYTPS